MFIHKWFVTGTANCLGHCWFTRTFNLNFWRGFVSAILRHNTDLWIPFPFFSSHQEQGGQDKEDFLQSLSVGLFLWDYRIIFVPTFMLFLASLAIHYSILHLFSNFMCFVPQKIPRYLGIYFTTLPGRKPH